MTDRQVIVALYRDEILFIEELVNDADIEVRYKTGTFADELYSLRELVTDAKNLFVQQSGLEAAEERLKSR